MVPKQRKQARQQTSQQKPQARPSSTSHDIDLPSIPIQVYEATAPGTVVVLPKLSGEDQQVQLPIWSSM